MRARSTRCNTAANAIRQAGEAIGLKAKFKSVSAQNYINFFTDPKAREGIDGFLDRQLPRLRRPGRALQHVRRCRTAARTTTGFDDPQITKAMNAARSTADPRSARSSSRQAGDLIMRAAAVDPDGGDQHGR